MKVLYKYAVILICLGFYQSASAVVPWVGTASYPGETKTDDFNSYKFGAGINLIKPAGSIGVGTSFTGYYQTMVLAHFLDGVSATAPGLTSIGSGSGYELTLVAEFTGEFTEVSGSSQTFEVTGGTTKLYYDSTPDYSFAADSGFSGGTEILSGGVTSGVGTILTAPFGIGVSSFEVDFSGMFGVVSGIYSPDTIAGGSALFSIKTKTATNSTPIIDSVKAGANSVLGEVATGGILAEADGSLQLVAVPIPSLTWLFGSFLLGVFAINKRRTVAMRNTISV